MQKTKQVIQIFSLAVLIFIQHRNFAQTAPFSVKSDLFNQSNTQTLGLSKAPDTETFTVFTPTSSTDHYSNAVAVIGFKGNLYCQWQSSQTDEDSEDTWVAYSVSSDGQNWSAPKVLAPSHSDGYRSSGGWWANGDTLVAYLNHWPASVSPRGGFTEYMTSTDGQNWSAIKRVKMANGSDLNAIFEQDPHAIPGGRIVNAAHFQPGLTASPIYTDDPSGIRGWVRASYTNMTYNGDVTREIEPSSYIRNDGNIVMVFRDQNGSYKRLAAMSSDRGQTWTTAVETNMPDSRSKQSAGNLTDGTAFLVGNPVNTNRRSPLAIALSANGQYFDKAFLIRNGGNELPALKYPGKAKTLGFSYPKSTIWNDYLYIGYSVNKEEVQISRIPLAALNLICTNGTIDDCNICSGGNTGIAPCTGFAEAENACSVDGIKLESKNLGFSGQGYVNTDNAIGASASWNFESTLKQTATISFRYANKGTTSRDGDIFINGKAAGKLILPPTGEWTIWKTVTVKLNLEQGINEITLSATTADGLANLDLIYFSEGVFEVPCIITGLNSAGINEEVEIFPNPVINKIHWKTSQAWVLTNSDGIKIQQGSGSSADLSSLPQGIYFLKLGETIHKIFKQ